MGRDSESGRTKPGRGAVSDRDLGRGGQRPRENGKSLRKRYKDQEKEAGGGSIETRWWERLLRFRREAKTQEGKQIQRTMGQ